MCVCVCALKGTRNDIILSASLCFALETVLECAFRIEVIIIMISVYYKWMLTMLIACGMISFAACNLMWRGMRAVHTMECCRVNHTIIENDVMAFGVRFGAVFGGLFTCHFCFTASEFVRFCAR